MRVIIISGGMFFNMIVSATENVEADLAPLLRDVLVAPDSKSLRDTNAPSDP